MVLQMLHDDPLPKQDHLHALHTALLPFRKDCRLCSTLPASRMARREAESRGWRGAESLHRRQCRPQCSCRVGDTCDRSVFPRVTYRLNPPSFVAYEGSNGSSLPPRLPYLSDVVKQLSVPLLSETPSSASSVRYTIAALSYRGFWTSRGRPSQRGIERDAEAFLDWTVDRYGSTGEHVKIVLWGQSIGAGVATTAASHHLVSRNCEIRGAGLSGVILETPFTSVRDMLVALYPQTWLPYRYLWPFLWNRWDSREALRDMTRSKEGKRVRILIVQAGKDELVPMEHGLELEEICRGNGVEVQRREVAGALHTEVMTKAQGRSAVVSFLEEIGRS